MDTLPTASNLARLCSNTSNENVFFSVGELLTIFFICKFKSLCHYAFLNTFTILNTYELIEVVPKNVFELTRMTSAQDKAKVGIKFK